MKLLREALARGYCSDKNSKKVLDADLIEDMAVEAEKFILGAVPKKPTKKELEHFPQLEIWYSFRQQLLNNLEGK